LYRIDAPWENAGPARTSAQDRSGARRPPATFRII
jgi:hypothetical protein